MLIGDQRGGAEKVTSSNEFVASSGSCWYQLRWPSDWSKYPDCPNLALISKRQPLTPFSHPILNVISWWVHLKIWLRIPFWQDSLQNKNSHLHVTELYKHSIHEVVLYSCAYWERDFPYTKVNISLQLSAWLGFLWKQNVVH